MKSKENVISFGLILLFVIAASVISLSKSDASISKPLAFIQRPTEITHPVLELMNADRRRFGISPLVWNDTLAKTSQKKLQRMSEEQVFSHELSDGKSFVLGIFGEGYPELNEDGTIVYVGENLSLCYLSPGEMEEAWMNSPGHKRNILEPRYTEAGVSIGLVQPVGYSNPCVTAVVHFGTRVE